MTNKNTDPVVWKIGQDAFCVKKKQGWAVQNVKMVFVWQKMGIVF